MGERSGGNIVEDFQSGKTTLVDLRFPARKTPNSAFRQRTLVISADRVPGNGQLTAFDPDTSDDLVADNLSEISLSVLCFGFATAHTDGKIAGG